MSLEKAEENREVNARRLKPDYQDFNKLVQAQWDYTRIVINGLVDPDYEEAPIDPEKYRFQGRHLIARDTPILGGVYTSRAGRSGEFCEALVVDEKYGELLKVWDKLLKKREEAAKKGKHFKEGLLNDILDLCAEVLPYDADAVSETDRALHARYPKEPAVKIALDVYLQDKVGVCRTQALLGAYLLEKCAREGRVRGKVSIDRNFQPGSGGHAWIRYTNGEGDVIIIDPAQHFIGYLKDLQKDRRNRKYRWPYEREEDIYE